jgi:hypothetical protein
MEIGYFTMPSHPPECGLKKGHDWDLQTLRWLDELGYQEAWIGEHHTAPWEPHPSPDLLLAQSVCRPKISVSAPVVSCCHIITRPSSPTASRCSITSPRTAEFRRRGIGPAERLGDVQRRRHVRPERDMTREALEIILKMWTEDAPWTHTGKFWTVSKPDTMFDFLKPHLKPKQAPHPPIGVAGLSKVRTRSSSPEERGYIPMSLNLNPAYVGSHGIG